MNKFETKIDYLKYEVLKQVAIEAWEGNLVENVLDIPKKIIPGKTPTMRCCVYKERAILQERVKLAMGGDRKNTNIIEIIDIACDECPIGGYEITTSCRGCLAQRCKDACVRNAITFDTNHQAHIDKNLCINCGNCARSCPYQAIVNRKRPCENACELKAISAVEDQMSNVSEDKCVQCGSCIAQCPFGAIMDKSYILDTIDYINKSENNTQFRVYALIAPAIVDSFREVKLGQMVAGLKQLGFYDVVETAVGADIAALKEAEELKEKGFLISSCCPSFVKYIRQNFPSLLQYVSSTPSPMVVTAQYLKEKDADCKVIFIGPCTSKKTEGRESGAVDSVITFEELQALLDSRDIILSQLPDEEINQASGFGRAFGRSGGLSESVAQGVKELGLDVEVKPVICNGITECKIALTRKQHNVGDFNFIEGMYCKGGCIGGAGVLSKFDGRKESIDKYASASTKESLK